MEIRRLVWRELSLNIDCIPLVTIRQSVQQQAYLSHFLLLICEHALRTETLQSAESTYEPVSFSLLFAASVFSCDEKRSSLWSPHRELAGEVTGVTFQTPTPPLFQNFSIRIQKFYKLENPTPVQTPVTVYRRSNRNLPMSLLKKWDDHADSCYCRNWKATPDPGPFFSQRFGSGSAPERKMQNPAGVDSGTQNPVPPGPLALGKGAFLRWSW